VEYASFALVEYLEAVLNNKPVQCMWPLFSQCRDVQETQPGASACTQPILVADHHTV
jgi:chemosensory pili system protein ChpA (sensor histidine kinase/response regulator)